VFPGTGLSAAAARAVLRNAVSNATRQARDEAEFFARLCEAGVLVRPRFSETCPGQVTGYVVGLPGHNGSDGLPLWYGGGRLATGLTLPRLRSRWATARGTAERSGAFRFTVPERNAIFEYAARQAGFAAESIRFCARTDPDSGADAAWAAADTLHIAARILDSPDLHRAADSYDRAARASYGRIPAATPGGNQLRAAARLMAMTGQITGDTTLATIALIANLVALAIAVAELRNAQQRVTQAAAAWAAASQMPSACVQGRAPVQRHRQAKDRRHNRTATTTDVARGDHPESDLPGRSTSVAPGRPRLRSAGGPLPLRRAGPSR
jgi:hypothetical protein